MPTSISLRRFAELPVSRPLSGILKKFGITCLGDVSGFSARDFGKVSKKSSELLDELENLITLVRAGELPRKAPSLSQTRSTRSVKTQAAKEIRQGSLNPGHNVTATPHPERDKVEFIYIPHEARGRQITEFAVSERLANVLEFKGFRLFGDLQGLSFNQFGEFRNCGRKTIQELRELVRKIQIGEDPSENLCEATKPAPVQLHCFFIPGRNHDLDPFELPLSVRLKKVLRKLRITRLGDLHGASVNILLNLENCGKRTITEIFRLLQRVIAGEFESSGEAFSLSGLIHLLPALERILATLALRDREILLLRLGAENDRVWTLEEVGTKFKLTRERVRQIVAKSIPLLRMAGGPNLRVQLEGIASTCHELICPLTPELLKQWLGEPIPRLLYPLPSYVRLLEELNSEIPAWPAGPEPSNQKDTNADAVTSAIDEVVRGNFGNISFRNAFQKLRSKPKMRNMTVQEFVSALHHCRTLAIEFPTPDQPHIYLQRLRAAELAKAVLEASESPLTPEEILHRGTELFGERLTKFEPRGIAVCLTDDKGIYLIGPRRYGLRSHFNLPSRTYPEARDNFAQLLKKENRPISTSEVVNNARFVWTESTNAYELAQILREDDRFIDLGKFLFALAEWGMAEREYVKDLVPKILEEYGRPMTGAQVLGRLLRLRSVSPYAISGHLRTHPLIRDYGCGIL